MILHLFPRSWSGLSVPFAAALVACPLRGGEDVPLSLGPRRDVAASVSKAGVVEISVDGTVPHFWTAPVDPSFDPGRHTVFAFEYFSPSGVEALHLRYRQSDGSMVYAGSAPLPVAETWQPFALDFSEVLPRAPKGDPQFRFHVALPARPASSLRIRNWRVREPSPAERAARAQREEIRSRREADAEALLSHLRAALPGEIREVVVSGAAVRVAGRAKTPLDLRELALHEASHAAAALPALATGLKGGFSLDLPRFAEDGRDRALSRWRLDRGDGTPGSRARWFDATAPGVAADLPKLVAPHQKGLGGIPPLTDPDHEIFELGIRHATVNIVMPPLLSPTARAGFSPFEVDGREWHANEAALGRLEKTVRILNEREVVVSGILLVPNRPDHPMTHPEAEARGIYSIPNLAEPEGAAHYRAAFALLADRFSRPGRRIANWIVHNEIDQAGVWTNMGEQPLARYLETYLRSARIVHHGARLRDPHARAFVSLTHHWTKPSIGAGAYTVRDLLELFAEMARAEGDFDWGVAYHPYPRDLRNPDAWKDTEATPDFDTPYITPKNLEVLPRYLAQPRFLRRDGGERAILFSEQGFNTPTLDEADQRRQVAGLVYTFRKLPSIPTLEAWHLHRYQDMPEQEGGLRLGILDEHGGRKLGWRAYAAIGGEGAEEFERIADEVMESP